MTEIKEKQRRKRERIVVVVLLVCVSLFTAFEIHLLRLSAKLPFVNSIFFFGLMNLNIILIMLLLFLVFRNAVKLILDERRGRIGSRLKTRLVFSFLLFAIIPTILLFSVSAFYIKNSFDSWFSARIGGTLQKSIEVVKNYYETTERNTNHFVRKIAFGLEGVNFNSAQLERELERARIEYGLDGVEYYRDPFSVRIAALHPERRNTIPRASLQTLQHHFDGANDCQITNVGVGELIRCGAFLGVEKGVLFANYFIPMSLASQLSEIALTYEDYKRSNPLSYPIKSTYFAILSMLTLLILFSAIWTGFYVARRLSVPLEELSKGTEEITKGNLSYTIPRQGSDELGRLVESFNRMSRDLREKTQQIEATNADLTKTNAELSHRKHYIEVLLESVQSGVISLDERGKISMINPAASELLGTPFDGLRGKPYWVLIPEERRSEFREILMSVYGKAKPVRRELGIRLPNGDWINLLVTLSVIRDENKKPMGVVAVFNDVTEMQKIQRMTAWREVAKRIAHEIKNPLTPIQLSVQRLRRRYLKKIEDDGTFGEATEIVLKEVDALKHLVSEFSAFARLPEIKQTPQDLNELLIEVVSLYRAAHEAVQFELGLSDDVPMLSLDRAQMKRVLINLFDNSVAAMDSKGTIRIRTELDEPSEMVRLTVSDDGCGVSESMAEQLFEPHFSTKIGGTGLGLAIVQRIVSDHGGFVRATKNEPQGTKLTLELPLGLAIVAQNTRARSERSEPVGEA